MGGASRGERLTGEGFIIRNIQDLEDPANARNRGSKAAHRLMEMNSAVGIALLRLAINREPGDLEDVLEKLDDLYSQVTSFERYLARHPRII